MAARRNNSSRGIRVFKANPVNGLSALLDGRKKADFLARTAGGFILGELGFSSGIQTDSIEGSETSATKDTPKERRRPEPGRHFPDHRVQRPGAPWHQRGRIQAAHQPKYGTHRGPSRVPRSQNIRGVWAHGRAMALKLAGNSLANLGLF
jgi:hypothetical protein